MAFQLTDIPRLLPELMLLVVALSFLPDRAPGLTNSAPVESVRPAPALYPSDSFSQAPPRAA